VAGAPRVVAVARVGGVPNGRVAAVETITVERGTGEQQGIVTITLNRPAKKNAINGPMWEELLETFKDIASRDDVRCVVLTGAGGAFCSGADLSGGPAERPRHQLHAMRRVGDVALALQRIPQPVIAKVPGIAAGAGCTMALGCDLIVASDEARFSLIFAKRGLSVDFGGTWLLPRLVGMHKAKELALFADIISAKEAEAMGLVNRVVPEAELDAFVDGWVAKLAAGPPIALAQTKRMLDNAMAATFEQALDDEGAAQTVNFFTDDTREAMSAFLDKRAPKFSGH